MVKWRHFKCFHTQERYSFIRKRMILQQQQDDPEECIWIERRTKRGYEMVMKAKILHSDPGRVEFMYDIDLPPKKYLIALHARGGRGNDHKVVVCRHEVSA